MSTETTSMMHADLQQFTGCEVPIRHNIARRLCFTDGVAHMRKAAEAYWLVDAIASYYHKGSPIYSASEDFQYLHIWTLRAATAGEEIKGDDLEEGAARFVLEAREDTRVPPVIQQGIAFTDFPFELNDKGNPKPFKLYSGLTMIGEDLYHILMLPTER
jgi:hypothetical protein